MRPGVNDGEKGAGVQVPLRLENENRTCSHGDTGVLGEEEVKV